MKSVLSITSLTLFLVCVRGQRFISLTTAVYHDINIYVKPTTEYRRIPVDKNVQDKSNTSHRIFHKIKPIRRSRADIWNWDYWCQLQLQIGNCTSNRQKYYYDTHLDQCLTFSYSGCHGNKNNFDTLVECERHCKGASFMTVKHIGRSSACSLQPNAGLCMAIYNKFYYNVNRDTCIGFIYSGCGGNANRFPSIARCLSNCKTEWDSIED